MAIDDLRKRLFRKNEDFTKRYKEPVLQKHREQVPVSWQDEEERRRIEEAQRDVEAQKTVSKPIERKIILWGTVGGLLVLAGVGGFLLLWGRGGVATHNTLKNIHMTVEGGEEVSSGKKVSWRVTYKNSNSAQLENAALIFDFPEGSQPLVGEFSKTGLRRERREVGTVSQNSSGEEVFSAIVFGHKGASLGGKVTIEYRPEDASARFSLEEKFSTFIKGTLLGLEFDIPNDLRAGQDAEVKLRIVSTAESVFRGLTVGISYPSAFEFTSATPKPDSGDGTWFIGDLSAGSEFVITLHGKIRKSESAETFKAQVGLYDRTKNDWKLFSTATESFSVASSLLTVGLDATHGEIAPGITSAGSRFAATVSWRNNLPVAVHNVSIDVSLDENFFDLRTLETAFGEYDRVKHAIRWTGGRVPQLSILDPGAEGRVDFGLLIKDDIPIDSFDDKNFVIRLKANISSAEIPPGFEGVNISGETEKSYKIASRVAFSQKGYYYDSRIQNSGPIPPRVGEETTYLIVWSVLNSVNDLKNVRVRATLPSYVDWKNVVIPPDNTISYKASTGEIAWSPGTIPAGTGYIQPAREIAFQIGFTPSLPHVGKSPQLISVATFEAEDDFTGTQFTRTGTDVSTALRDDPQVQQSGGAVRE